MNKQEFMSRVNKWNPEVKEPTAIEYENIEYVYTWHPSIDSVKGKDQIAYLYVNFGMRVIYDMITTAHLAEEAEAEMNKAYAIYLEAKNKYLELSKKSF